MKYIYLPIIIAFSFLGILFGCVEDPEMETRLQNVKIPEVSATSSIGIHPSSLDLKFTVEKENGAQIKECGVCWSTSEETLPADNMLENRFMKANATEGKEFSVTISNLKDKTKYYIYAYATNEAGTGFSASKQTYTTISGIGEVTTVTPDSANVKATSALVKGVITLRAESIEELGFYYSQTNKEPSDKDHKKLCTDVDPASVDTFSVIITDLTPQTKYYVRAFAKNSFGEFAFNADSFITTSGIPLVTNMTVESTDYTTASVSAVLLQQGDAPVTVYGFCWSSIDKEPRIETGADTIVSSSLSEANKFSGVIRNLQSSQKYYVRAYAKNQFGTAYSKEVKEISTLNKEPNVITYPIEETGAIFNGIVAITGELQNGGESPAVEWGICLSATANPPTITNGITIAATDSAFTCMFSKLKGATTYYYRAYGRNTSGLIGYGKTFSFKTPDIFTVLPSNRISARTASAQFVLNSRTYILGGDQGAVCSNELFGFAPVEGAWIQMSSFPQELGHMATATHENIAYIMGGLGKTGKSNQFTAYIASANTWKDLTPISSPRYDAVGFTYNNLIYMLGGEDDLGKTDELWGYDPVSTNWSKVATPFPAYQKKGIAVVVEDMVYAGLGEGSKGRFWYSSGSLSNWTEILSVPAEVAEVSSAVYYKNEKWNSIFMINTQGKIWEYNLSKKIWVQHSTFPLAANYHIFVINDELYIIGQNIYNESYFRKYDPIWDPE